MMMLLAMMMWKTRMKDLSKKDPGDMNPDDG